MPNAIVAVRRSGVITACEKYGGTAASSAFTVCAACGTSEQVGERQRRAQLGRVHLLQAGVACLEAVRLEHARLQVGHPADRGGRGHRAVHGHVDLAGHAGRVLQLVHVAQRLEVLRHELAHVRLDGGLRVGHPADHRDRQPIASTRAAATAYASDRRPRARAHVASSARPAGISADQQTPSGTSTARPPRPHDHGVHDHRHHQHDQAQRREHGGGTAPSRARRRRAARAATRPEPARAASAAEGQPASPPARRSARAWRGPR